MESLLRPVGPEPERVYWMRRGAVLLALVLVLSLLFWGLGKLFGGDDKSTDAVPASQAGTPSAAASTPGSASPSASASASASGSESASSSASTSASTSASATPSATSASPTPTGPVTCAPDKLTLKVEGPHRSKSGENMQLKVSVTSEEACFLDFTKTPLELRVYSGSDRIWTTNHCDKWQARNKVDFTPGKTWTRAWTWETLRSADGCTLKKDEYLRPGTYVATAEVKGATPAQRIFQLVG